MGAMAAEGVTADAGLEAALQRSESDLAALRSETLSSLLGGDSEERAQGRALAARMMAHGVCAQYHARLLVRASEGAEDGEVAEYAPLLERCEALMPAEGEAWALARSGRKTAREPALAPILPPPPPSPHGAEPEDAARDGLK